MHTYGTAGIALNNILGCFGNNISISRVAYETIGGYQNIPFSVTEDYALLNSIHKAGFKIRYLCGLDTTVETLPLETFSQYLLQRKR
jgi:cellulose synthase/poly-beta-1,6-N-acetylglucosamine synthase-like glycosyltransferase